MATQEKSGKPFYCNKYIFKPIETEKVSGLGLLEDIYT